VRIKRETIPKASEPGTANRLCKATGATPLILLSAFIALAAISLFPFSAPLTSYELALPGLSSLPTIVAHRGGDEAAPETSLISFETAAARNLPVEMDLRTLSDGGIAISHDSTTGNEIIHFKSTDIDLLSTKLWNSLCLKAATRVCYSTTTYREVLSHLPITAETVVENKQAEVSTTRLEKILARTGRAHSTLVESLDFNEIKQLGKDGFRSLYVVHKGEKIDVTAVARAKTEVLAVSSFYSTSLLAKAHTAHLKLWVWTVDRQTMALKWEHAGVDGIITDHPFAMTKLLAMDVSVTSCGITTTDFVTEALTLQANPENYATRRRHASSGSPCQYAQIEDSLASVPDVPYRTTPGARHSSCRSR
jgi:glycerophosphoryl diester phosphodiesterase